MDYNHIEGFLARFKKLLTEGEAARSTIAEVITKHISSPVDVKMIKIKGVIIQIQGSPMLRNEILMHTREIMADLDVSIPGHRFTQIR